MAKKWHGTYEGTFDVSISRIDIHLDECTKRWKFSQMSGKRIIFPKKNPVIFIEDLTPWIEGIIATWKLSFLL